MLIQQTPTKYYKMTLQFEKYVVVLLLLLLQTLESLSDTTESNKHLWTWNCVSGKCVPTKATQQDNLQCLNTCIILCGSITIWPYPTGSVSLSNSFIPVRAESFSLQKVKAPAEVTENLRRAFYIFLGNVRSMERSANGSADWRNIAVAITVNGSSDSRMRVDTDESYILKLWPDPNTLEITAQSFCGARHALETMLQMIWLDTISETLLAIEKATIEDAPRFKYRGLMLDTSRTYFPVKDLLRTIDTMATFKLNTFHWHISDSQSFPLTLKKVPILAKRDAYGSSAVYTPADVRKVVRHAKLRGIRILLEVDTPAHVGEAWNFGTTKGLGNLVHCLNASSSHHCQTPPCGQLNPRNHHISDFIEGIYSEILELTDVDDIFHLGGDDISPTCWQEHFEKSELLNLWFDFTQSALQSLERAVKSVPKLIILWFSQFNQRIIEYFPEYGFNLCLQVRKSASKDFQSIRTLISNDDAWDLNTGMTEWYEDSSGSPYNSWQRVYEHRPWVRDNLRWIEGGEVTVWSTTLMPEGLDARVWPRAVALSERLWSDPLEGATRTVHVRLDIHRSRLIARGIGASPIWSMWCTHNSFTCV